MSKTGQILKKKKIQFFVFMYYTTWGKNHYYLLFDKLIVI